MRALRIIALRELLARLSSEPASKTESTTGDVLVGAGGLHARDITPTLAEYGLPEVAAVAPIPDYENESWRRQGKRKGRRPR